MRKQKIVAIVAAFAVLGLSACDLSVAEEHLDVTYNARQCIIDRESREAGMYTAENPTSTASGAYQWLDSSWQVFLPFAEEYYGARLTSLEEEQAGAREHAAFASPYVQDVVAAHALMVRPQNARPWPYRSCWAKIGEAVSLRDDGPVYPPTAYLQGQIDSYLP